MTPRGRPRSFDRDAALRRATELFWRQGYHATSVSDLTAALGITPPSLYTAFGSKRGLFAEVVDHYQATAGAAVTAAFTGAATARAGTEAMLRTAAADYTASGRPPGCLVISAAVNCRPDEAEVRADLRARRAANIAAMADRFTAAAADGEPLPPGTRPHALAAFYAAVLQGMSQRAQDGADRAELEEVAATAMAAWPAAG
jgi:AcrR family transcriptional regulator